jgi:hypothetical protein
VPVRYNGHGTDGGGPNNAEDEHGSPVETDVGAPDQDSPGDAPIVPDGADGWSKDLADAQKTFKDPAMPVSINTARILTTLGWPLTHARKDINSDVSVTLDGIEFALRAYVQAVNTIQPNIDQKAYKNQVYLMEAIEMAWGAAIGNTVLPHHDVFMVWRFYTHIAECATVKVQELSSNMSYDLAVEDEICVLVAAMHVHQCRVVCHFKGSSKRVWTFERVGGERADESRAKSEERRAKQELKRCMLVSFIWRRFCAYKCFARYNNTRYLCQTVNVRAYELYTLCMFIHA